MTVAQTILQTSNLVSFVLASEEVEGWCKKGEKAPDKVRKTTLDRQNARSDQRGEKYTGSVSLPKLLGRLGEAHAAFDSLGHSLVRLNLSLDQG